MRLRAIAFLAGVAALEAAILIPADSLQAHVVSHALVAVVAAPLLVIAAPLGSLLRPLSPGARRGAVAGLRRAPSAPAGRPGPPGPASWPPTGPRCWWRARSTT